MGKMKDIIIELGITKDQLENVVKELNLTTNQFKDRQIKHFALDVAYRKQTGKWYQYWNGKIKNFIAKFIVRRTYYDKFKTKIIKT